MDSSRRKYHSDVDDPIAYKRSSMHSESNGRNVPKGTLNSKDENGLTSASECPQAARSPRYEAFVMTGDKMLRLNPKISPNYARLKQSQLPMHTEILDTSMSFNNANRSMEGPFSDLETLGTQQEKTSTAGIRYKYLQEHANILKALKDFNGLLPVSQSENILADQDQCSSTTIQKMISKGDGGNAPQLSAGAASTSAGADDLSSSPKTYVVGGVADDRSPLSAVDFKSAPASPAHHAISASHTNRPTVAHQSKASCDEVIEDVENFSALATKLLVGSRSIDSGQKSLADSSAALSKNGRAGWDDDRGAAKRLARRLFELEGFTRESAALQLSKNNDFSAAVASEYMKLFNFAGLKIDAAIRMLLKNICLMGETSDKERILSFFSRRYYECNPSLFNSENEVHTLCCALMLLNSDIHNACLSRHMSSREFVDNVLQAGHNYSMDLLKSLYQSIKASPIECSSDPDAQSSSSRLCTRTQLVDARFLDIPDPDSQIEYKKGWIVRKCLVDGEGRRMPFGRRSWRMFYATLKGMILYLHKEEFSSKKGFYHSAYDTIRIHHALAIKATDYCKKQNVFKLQTATLAEYYFQTSDPREMQEWINAVNFVAACFSSPALPSAVSWRSNAFHRPFLASAPSRLSLRDQLEMHETRVLDTQKQLSQHRAELPHRCAKPRVLQAYAEKEIFLIYELERYCTYAKLLRPKVEELSNELTVRQTSQEYYCSNGSGGDSEVDAVKTAVGTGVFVANGQSTDSDTDKARNDYKTVHVKGGGYETTF